MDLSRWTERRRRVEAWLCPFASWTRLFLLLLACKFILRILFCSGDEKAIFKFVTLWFESGLGNPWDYAVSVDPVFANYHPPPFPYPPWMLYILAVPRGVTYLLGWQDELYSPLAGLPLSCFLVALDAICGAALVGIAARFGWSRRGQFWLFWGWHLSLVSLYATYLQTQFDIIPVCLTVLFFWAALARRYRAATLALLLAILTKSYPLLLVVVYAAMVLADDALDWRGRLRLGLEFIGFGLLLAAAAYLPFLGSAKFAKDVLENDEKLRVYFVTLRMGVDYLHVLVVPAWYVVTALLLFSSPAREPERLARFTYALLVPFVCLMPPMPMWYLWAHPFFLLSLGGLQRGWLVYLLVVGAYFGYHALFDHSALTQLMAYCEFGLPFKVSFVRVLERLLEDDPAMPRRLLHILYTAVVCGHLAVFILPRHQDPAARRGP